PAPPTGRAAENARAVRRRRRRRAPATAACRSLPVPPRRNADVAPGPSLPPSPRRRRLWCRFVRVPEKSCDLWTDDDRVRRLVPNEGVLAGLRDEPDLAGLVEALEDGMDRGQIVRIPGQVPATAEQPIPPLQ